MVVSKRVLNKFEKIFTIFDNDFLKNTNICFYMENLNDYKTINTLNFNCDEVSNEKPLDIEREGKLLITSKEKRVWKERYFI